MVVGGLQLDFEATGHVMAVGVVGLLKMLGAFVWRAVRNSAAKSVPVDHNTLASSLSCGKREVKESDSQTTLWVSPRITPQPRCHLELVFGSPVTRLEKNQDWTGPQPIRTAKCQDRSRP